MDYLLLSAVSVRNGTNKEGYKLIKIIQQNLNITVYLSLIYIHTTKNNITGLKIALPQRLSPCFNCLLFLGEMQTYRTSYAKVNTGAVVKGKMF